MFDTAMRFEALGLYSRGINGVLIIILDITDLAFKLGPINCRPAFK